MPTILNRLVERLDVKIANLRKAKRKLKEKNLEDKQLDHQIKRLVSIRDRLRKHAPTEGGGIDSDPTSTT